MSPVSANLHLQCGITIVIKNDFVGSLIEQFLPRKQADIYKAEDSLY